MTVNSRRIRIGYCLLGVVVCLLGGIFSSRDRARAAGVSPLQIRVLGYSRWLSGGPASLRVIVTDHRTGAPVHADVRLALHSGTQSEIPLFTGNTTRLGTLDAQFALPRLAIKAYRLTVDVHSPLGSDRITEPVQVEQSAQIMLSTDKPLYQPGQTMHLRVLALDTATRAALGLQPITFEVEDARGNKVFKRQDKLSKFGLASADFTLADEVNMGSYTLRAILPIGTTEKAVRVERYLLPKYKLALTTDKPYYLPGETVHGTLQADYFFGKPVSGGEVTVDVSTLDIELDKLAELTGKTGDDGSYKFDYQLPDHFVGQPFEQGKAVVTLHGSVVDTAKQMQEVNANLPVVKDPIILVVVPEHRQLVVGVPNRVFIAAASPDGAPLKHARLRVTNSAGSAVTALTTDELGLATYTFTPATGNVSSLNVSAETNDGMKAETTFPYDQPSEAQAIILRVDRPLAKVGEALAVSAVSSRQSGTIYLDVLRNEQTILTRALEVNKGRADLKIPLSNDMVGTLTLHAYEILPNEDIIRDTRLVIVSPANDLTISMSADKPTYSPGDDAALTFNVQDAGQHPMLAALGVSIVDESVFALAELQPGLAKIYFTLEKELMEPKYQIQGLTPANLLLPPAGAPQQADDAARQHAAQVLFAAADSTKDFDFNDNSYQRNYERRVAAEARIRARNEAVERSKMQLARAKIVKALRKYHQLTGNALTSKTGLWELVHRQLLDVRELYDHWGHPYRFAIYNHNIYERGFTISSAGAHGRWGTGDNITDDSFMPRGRFAHAVPMPQAIGGMVLAMPAPIISPHFVEDGGFATSVTTADIPGNVISFSAVVPTQPASSPAVSDPPRIRQYFPETMYWNPAIITDEQGRATIHVPMADSITNWRVSMLANNMSGQLGSGDAPLRVFQDFFVDIDLPLSLTQHDRVEIPVSVYNYLPEAQTVTLTLEQGDWFVTEGESVRTLAMGKNEVKVIYFPITVTKLGHFALTVDAQGTKLADAVRRSIDVLPDGQEVRTTINDRLTSNAVAKTVSIPRGAIDGASNIWVKLYPGTFSQVVEGLDGILRMPNGCFEQTSSTTFPNVLVLNYLKHTKQIKPELQMKAEQYINVGYQRLVTFECKKGGFSWFGDDPANQVLTAYGLLEFSDMAKVHDVDPTLISRTQQWLAGKQQDDGAWAPDSGGIAEGIINQQTGSLRTTAYLAWALAESGYDGPQVGKALQYLRAHRSDAKDPYTLAVILNLQSLVDRNNPDTDATAAELIKLATVTDKTACWQGGGETCTGATAQGADLETTGLATFALVKWGGNGAFTTKALTNLVSSKSSFGDWSSTQGTVWSLKALLLAGEKGAGGTGTGTVSVAFDGKQIKQFTITPNDNDLMRQIDLGGAVKTGDNAVTLTFHGEGSLQYQIVGRYYLPWTQVAQAPAAPGPLSISVQYDKTELAQNDLVSATVTVSNTTDAIANMPLIDLGIAPGFSVDTGDMNKAVSEKTISKYTQAARQIIVYLDKLDAHQTVTLTYQLKAKYPIRARTPQSSAYPYYNPEEAVISAPQNIVVH